MDICLFRCLRCKKSLQRFRPVNVFKWLSSRGDKYLCPHCSRRYYTPSFINVIHKVVVGFMSIMVSILFFPDDRVANIFDVIFITLFITYAIGAFTLLKPVSLNKKE